MHAAAAALYTHGSRSVTNGMGVDMTVQLMYAAPFGNLFSDIYMGGASEPWGWAAGGQVRGEWPGMT